MSALHLTINPIMHAHSKYIEVDYHYVRKRIALDLLHTKRVSSSSQLADILTKAHSKHDLS